jgi:glycosyltransferase involved in cell wall biosynthesis
MDSKKNIYWLDLSRFDTKVNKSPWLEMSESLCDQGFKVTLLCGFERDRFIPAGYQLTLQYFKALQFAGLFRYSLLLNMALWLIRNARSEDIIIVRPGSLIVGKFIKLFCKCHIHMDIRTVPVEVHSFRDRVDRLLFWTLPLTFLKTLPDSFSFITKPLKNSVEAEFKTSFPDCVIWTSGVNTLRFVTMQAAKRTQPKDTFILFYHGIITENRGIDLVIKAVAMLDHTIQSNLLFQVVGRGYDETRLKALAQQLGIEDKVQFPGYLPFDKIAGAIKAADCCICPLPNLHDWNVSSPIKVFEYLACAKPIILTPITAHKNIFSEDASYIVWADDDSVDNISCAIRKAYQQRDSLTKKAAEAITFVEKNHDWKVQGEKLANYLNAKTIK